MSSIFDGMDLEGVQEPQVLDANTEAQIRITSVKVGKDKNELDYIMPSFEVVGNDFAKDFNKYMVVPNAEAKKNLEPKRYESARFELDTFFKAFEIDPSRPGDPEDWCGNTGWAILGVKDDPTYGKQNTIRKFVTPR